MSIFKKKTKETRFKKVDETTYVDKETGEVISTFIPMRNARRLGRAILRQGKLKMFLLVALLIVMVLFVIAFMQEKQGNFVINLDRLELFRKGIALSSDAAFTEPTSKLVANSIENATCISVDDLPANINEIDGDHNGKNYMAYTYYIRNAGKEPVNYTAVITMDSATKGAEEAVRVGVWKNDDCVIYAEPAADGLPEKGCVNFEDRRIVCTYLEDDFQVGNVDKYTVVIWLEGDDPECKDPIVGGALQFTMKMAAASEDDSSLLDKFIEDVKDTLNGNDSIGAAGTEAPEYTQYGNVNWYTRKNQEESN